VDPAIYDLYLRASAKSFAPDELRTCIGLLEVATQRTKAPLRTSTHTAWIPWIRCR
jgi:hypothetical protein